jgi:hypothetical protein
VLFYGINSIIKAGSYVVSPRVAISIFNACHR